ncbi:cell division protein ZapA [Thioalkalivibrio denitrificans]|uniref:Cell division protein ZapA n=1 Tax=Thioalkalivibrio denitrificans TaxID=108003 RepID=A0A1V3NIT8_9GAMM|nr:cell division protein ZapA [Thioalkalivibrio denitrificans]OOG24798.1 cell division protein ZapA [Thioalkalivibrio denitrificans]
MSNRTEPVSVQILGKEYQVACPDDERSALLASASLLDRRMQEIRDSGRIIGGDRIAVMAALNITHEMLVTRNQRESLSQTLSSRIRALQDKIDHALENGQQMDL